MKLIIGIIIITILILLSYNDFEYFENKNKVDSSPLLIEDTKINFIYNTIDGVYKIFSDKYFTNYHITNKKRKIKDIVGLDYVDSGFYNYKHNYLGLLKDNNIYKYDLFTKTLGPPIIYTKYFNGINSIKNKSIKTLFYFNNLVYIFIENTISTYNLNKDEIINDYDSEELFEKIPENIDGIFINYNDINQNNPIPYIYVLKNKKYYKYQYIESKFKFVESNIFKFEHKNIILTNNTNYKFKKDGEYRIYLVGGGNTYGGKGGLIFNDYNLKKNDILNCIIGKQGTRIPVKETVNSKLPYNGSCSGAGGTSIYKNNELLMISGGGGGWTSELIKSPNICNSVNYFDKKRYKPNFFFPIKKIVIMSDISNTDERYKIAITKLDMIVKNYDEIKLSVTEEPKYDFLELKDKKYKYQTNFSNKNQRAFIEIKFDKILIDYNIKLDYTIISSQNDNEKEQKLFLNSNLIIFDEQNRQYKINNFNTLFNKNITSINLFKYLSNSSLPSIEINPKKQTSNKYLYLKGGNGDKGGGGFATSNKYDKLNMCGGGGGYNKGKSIILTQKFDYNNINYPVEYVGATGGTSYIKKNNLNTMSSMYDQFINTYNESDGYIVINNIK
jgi:hypothetical protein